MADCATIRPGSKARILIPYFGLQGFTEKHDSFGNPGVMRTNLDESPATWNVLLRYFIGWNIPTRQQQRRPLSRATKCHVRFADICCQRTPKAAINVTGLVRP